MSTVLSQPSDQFTRRERGGEREGGGGKELGRGRERGREGGRPLPGP
jgi:hypothetical protein